MKKLKEKITVFFITLGICISILICFFLLNQILYWTLCIKRDHNIPKNTEVIISSCLRPTVTGVPSGELLLVYEGLTDKTYFLDLKTGEKRKVPNDLPLSNTNKAVFLDSKLVWLVGSINGPEYSNYMPHYILDLADGQRYEILDLTNLPRLEGTDNFNPDNYSYIQSADRVFIDFSKNILIALSTDFRTNQNGRVILSGYISDDDEFLVKLVKDLGMDYENVEVFTAFSPKGTYVVHSDGIYLSSTNKRFMLNPGNNEHYFPNFVSWYSDESGIVVEYRGRYWLEPRIFGDYGWNFYYLYSPVLKLNLPAQ